LTQRHDLAVSRAKVADAQRAVEQAADALRADLTVEAGASYDSRDLDGKARDRAGHANVELGLPWDRTAERIDYRQRLLDLEAATRTVEAAEDQVKLDVRKALRSLAAAASAYAIQCEAVRVAERRVRSTDLFQQAGRAEMRDVLEARASLLNSRNDLVSAMIRYRLAGLELGRDTASLEMTEEGLWREPDTRFAP
jgi:outer membrane protein TolC